MICGTDMKSNNNNQFFSVVYLVCSPIDHRERFCMRWKIPRPYGFASPNKNTSKTSYAIPKTAAVFRKTQHEEWVKIQNDYFFVLHALSLIPIF